VENEIEIFGFCVVLCLTWRNWNRTRPTYLNPRWHAGRKEGCESCLRGHRNGRKDEYSKYGTIEVKGRGVDGLVPRMSALLPFVLVG
jgi:hypothetical protein